MDPTSRGSLATNTNVSRFLLIFANKQDIEGALTSEEILRALDLEALLKRHWRVAGCSAVSGGGLLDAFDWIVGDIGNRIYLVD